MPDWDWEDDGIDLARPRFLRGSLREMEQRVVLDEFMQYITDVVATVNDGKEATVYLCRAKREVGVEHLAAKVYRARKFRAFANESTYVQTRRMRDRRLAKAVRGRSRKGRQAMHVMWQRREWDALVNLHAAGASVPIPYAFGERGILMEYVAGDGVLTGAPVLSECRLTVAEAQTVWHAVRRDIECLLDCGLVHGDLSAYNILMADGRARLIDLPQAVQIDEAPDAWLLFLRDVENVCSYFERQGLTLDAVGEAHRLWRRGRT
jgi:RIO kinase 1